MPSTVIVGTQYGDEGKGKIVDFLAKDSDYIVRYQGGNNAGHTVVINGEETILHLLPSGVFHNKPCVLGNGMVLDLEKLKEEIDELEGKGINIKDNLIISSGAHLILPEHVELSKQDGGSTNRGIAPSYSNKFSRKGIRAIDLINIEKDFNGPDLKARENLPEFKEYLEKHSYLKDKITNTSYLLNNALENNKNILFEGAQATGLDIDFGQYPFVTSSNCTSGGACTGSGVPPTKIDKVIGIAKAYTTRVDRDGEGPLTTQLDDEIGEKIREIGQEYGATTKRPRRCGWFDTVLVKYATMISGISEIVLTKLDVLDFLDEIKICTHYEINGVKTTEFPADGFIQRNAIPVYETLPGWKTSIKEAKTFEDLPENCKNYIKKIEELIGVPIKVIGNGPDREQTIFKN